MSSEYQTAHEFYGKPYPNFPNICEQLKANTELEYLRISNTLSIADIRILAQVLYYNEIIVQLDFTRSGMTDVEFLALLPSISTMKSLKSLTIRLNKISDSSAVALSETLLEGNIPLKYLNLSGNNIGPSGCKALSRMIESNLTLKRFIMEGNPVMPAGCKHLVNGLEKNLILMNMMFPFCRALFQQENYEEINRSFLHRNRINRERRKSNLFYLLWEACK